MSFIGELFSKVGSSKSYCVINFGGEYIYAEGVDKIVSISDSAIVFASKDKLIEITGKDMQIEDLDYATIMVKGKVVCVQEK